MHIDARNIDQDSLIKGDICIIGAGAAGISMALDWINTSSKIILLEGGGFDFDSKIQDLYKGENTGQRYFPIRSSRLHLFGGTTGHWGGLCAPFDPLDFKERPWVPHSGWPIDLNDLHPYYQKAHKSLELGPYEYEMEYWRQAHPDMTPLPLNEEVVWSKMWQFSPPTRFGTKYRETIEKASNIELYTYANCIDIEANEEVSEIKQVHIANLEGKSHRVRAKYYVLACGAIQNARLLLASNKQAPQGLGNDNDNVGRYFMEHLELKSAELWLSKPFSTALYGFRSKDRRPRAELAITEKVQEEHKMLNGTSSLTYLPVAREQKALIDLWENEDPRLAYDNFVKNFRNSRDYYEKETEAGHRRAYELYTRMEQAPNPNSKISLDNEKDDLGMQRAKLHWDLTELDRNSIRKLYQIIGREVGLSGVGRVRLDKFLWDEESADMPDILGGGWHHMGTTRMHNNPKNGVVNDNCRVHGISNLFIGGSACFPTAGAPNPTLTLVALTLRLSDYLKSKVG
ncbi:MAG: FAD-dependent oxidoreductase [Flavobacteriaceae bacterium]